MNKELIKKAYQLGYKIASEKKAEGEYQGDAEFPARGGTRAIGNDFLERLGGYTTLGSATGIGALLGSNSVNRALGKIKLRGIAGKGRGAVAGLATGILANMLGRSRAFFSDGRTSQDQIDYDHRLRFKNLLVPGAAEYNHGKRKEREKITRWH